MSYISNTNGINVTANPPLANQGLANLLAQSSVNNTSSIGPIMHSVYETGVSLPRSAKPSFKLEFYLAENGGFVMGLMGWNTASYTETCKLFIIKDLENMGRDIQNILAIEILKQ